MFPFKQKTHFVFHLVPSLEPAPKVSVSGEIVDCAFRHRFNDHRPPLTDHLK
jgi:hypothetical protein